MEIKDITYEILEDENTGERQYFLDKEPWQFIDPKTVNIGDIVYFDPNGLNRFGIVMNIRNEDYIYYDVSRGTKMELEEIAMFQVYKVDKGGEND
jgi:hypothetical protein